MKVVVTGATGFVGQHFVECALQKMWELNILCHRQKYACEGRVSKVVVGDIGDAEVWRKLLSPGAIVVNLAFTNSETPERSIEKLSTMVDECVNAGVTRLVHCSTASVYGNTSLGIIDEDTPCVPDTAYAKVKYLLEESLIQQTSGILDLAIVRPTEVFGENGRGLVKLAGDLKGRHPIANYLAACINSLRPMHLVSVATLVEGLLFLCDYPNDLEGEAFIVSEDDVIGNNYRDVASILMEEFEVTQFPLPQVCFPLSVLRAFLHIAGKPSAGTKVSYDNTKFERLGFRKSTSFEDSLRSFCRGSSLCDSVSNF